ncbi:MAG: hypothetical protein HZA49_01965 [Planctomycetes bacterium]|nr:hypothetical protein [Planctomycetota bacterium]
MDSVTKSKIIIAGIVWVLAIITWWYAIKKIPFRFLIQDTAIGLGVIIGLFVMLEIVSRKYKLGGIEIISEWPSMWIGFVLFILAGGAIIRYRNFIRTKETINTEEKK